LAKVTYLDDSVGQTVNGDATGGDKQRSTVVSVDAEYDLNETWSIGGKLGYRMSELAPAGTSIYSQNDAGLAVARITYHDPLDWDVMAEYRVLESYATKTRDTGFVVTAYRHINENVKLGLGYNFGRFSDDLLDTNQDHRGIFLNLVAKF
jgi:outer membrane protein assembly factor BamA